MLVDYLQRAIHEIWLITIEASPYVLFGLIAAGVLYTLFPQEKIHGFLGRKSFGSVLKAALVGIPLPLCSCGVIPAAMTLRRRGASRGATTAFLISTPETGVDSIALTYGLMGPFMTIVRPLAALITAVTAGILVNAVDRNAPAAPASPPNTCPTCNSDTCTEDHPYISRLRSSLRYVFVELLGDIGGWLILGFILSGLISAFVPDNFFDETIGSEWVTMLLMLVVGLPMYICASASTPVAAALMLKGVSPGAALILLMVGPATNVTTMVIVARELGRKIAVVYVGAIVVCSLLIAFIVNAVAGGMALDIASSFSPEQEVLPMWIRLISTAVLFGFIGNHYRKKLIRRKPACSCGTQA